MKRLLLAGAVAIVGLPVLAGLAVVAWLQANDGDLTAHREFIGRQLGRVIGRDVSFAGQLRLALSAQPTLTVTDFSIANATWGQASRLLSVQRIELQTELLPLLRGEMALSRLVVQGVRLQLEVDANGHRNWDLSGDAGRESGAIGFPGLSRTSALDLRVEDSAVAYQDSASGRDWMLSVDRGAIQSTDWEAPLAIALESTWAGVPLHVTGTAGPLSALASGTTPYPLDLTGELLGIRYSASGEVTPGQPADVRLTVQAQAESLDAARAVFGEVVPAAAPLQLAMTVSGSREATSANLEAAVGASRIKGNLDLDVGKPRPRMGGQIELDQLDLRPWLAPPPTVRGATETSAPAELPAIALPNDLDADIDLRARQVVLPNITVDDLSARLVRQESGLALEDVKLAAKPFEVAGRIAVDTAAAPPAITLTLTAARVDAAWLLGSDGAGTLSATADLTLLGADPAGWVQSIQGQLTARLRGTTPGDEVEIGLRRSGSAATPAQLDARGRWRDMPVQVTGKVGAPSHWLSPDQPTPVDLSARLGKISVSATGRITDLAHAKSVTLVVQADAPTLEDVAALWGIKHSAEGPVRLKTRLEGGPDNWELSDLTGEIGSARAAGRLSLSAGRQKPKVEGRLTLTDVRLKSLLPPPAVTTATRGSKPATQRLIPTTPLAFRDLSAFDAVIALAGSRLDLAYHLLPTFTGNLRVEGGRLRLHVGGAEARERTKTIDFEISSAGSVPSIRLQVQDPEAEAATMLAGTDAAGLLTGRVAVDLDLRGGGDSLAAILGSLEGHAHLLMGQGAVNTASLDRLVVGVQTLFDSLLGTDRKPQRLNCAFVELKASTGVLKGAALLDTEASTFALDGTIDLAREMVEISGTPLQKGIIRFSTAVPVRLTGSLANPRAEVQKVSTLLRLGMLIAKLNPATALPAFGVAALEEVARGNPCVEKIREAAQDSR